MGIKLIVYSNCPVPGCDNSTTHRHILTSEEFRQIYKTEGAKMTVEKIDNNTEDAKDRIENLEKQLSKALKDIELLKSSREEDLFDPSDRVYIENKVEPQKLPELSNEERERMMNKRPVVRFQTDAPFEEIEKYVSGLKRIKDSGERVTITQMNWLHEMIKTPNWGSFYGYNMIKIPDFEMSAGGGVSFSQHLNKELSAELWEDLLLRLQVRHIQVYRYNDAIPCVAMLPNSVQINLDENNRVKDIRYTL
jgi:hypothetical protein